MLPQVRGKGAAPGAGLLCCWAGRGGRPLVVGRGLLGGGAPTASSPPLTQRLPPSQVNGCETGARGGAKRSITLAPAGDGGGGARGGVAGKRGPGGAGSAADARMQKRTRV